MSDKSNPRNLAMRSMRSSTYTMSASGIQTVIGFVRSIVLARLLFPDDFGIYAYAVSFLAVTSQIPVFGFGSALVHRAPESEGNKALEVYLSLSLLFNAVWAFIIVLIGFFFFPPESRGILFCLLGARILINLTQPAKSKLVRGVVFRRISIIEIANTLLGTLVAIYLAWRGFGVWSLVSTDLIHAVIYLIGFYVIKPPWKPKISWSNEIAKYFFEFGKRTFGGHVLGRLLDEIDDLWIGSYLGDNPLGLYSRAFTFATYPRKVLASPLNSVATGTYAELKDHPKKLSQAFFRVNAFLIRVGFYFSGLFVLVAPEFIMVVIGEKWLPMLTTFRLMLIYTLVDPIKETIATLFVAVGFPEKVVKVRIVQLILLIVLLYIFGSSFGIDGVALAVDIMVLVGVITLLINAKNFVRFSAKKLFLIPSVAVFVALIIGYLVSNLPFIMDNDFVSGGIKAVVFSGIYTLILFIFERENIQMLFRFLKLKNK